MAKCPGCGARVTFQPTPEALEADKADDASHELECPACGYRTANLITLADEGRKTKQ
jgi:DNA-directed RNA polymerase subunit RPC12/RpoP